MAHVVPVPPRISVRLRDYLSGHLLRKAMQVFESEMGPLVKREVQRHVETDPATREQAAARETQIAAAIAERSKLDQAVREREEANAEHGAASARLSDRSVPKS